MDLQTLTPGSSGPFSSYPSGGGGGKSPILIILIVLFAIGTIVFGLLTVTFAGKVTKVTKAANAQQAVIEANARESQKKIDDEANITANESPYRVYTAPQKYGSFSVNFPKNWTSYVDEETNGTQVTLILNPDFIRRNEGIDAHVAMKVKFINQNKDDFMAPLLSATKAGQLKQIEIKVSQQPAYDFTGTFREPALIHQVVVPIRDKVLVFSSEDAQYANEFTQILAQAKIIP